MQIFDQIKRINQKITEIPSKWIFSFDNIKNKKVFWVLSWMTHKETVCAYVCIYMTSSTENRLVLLLWLYTILCCCLLLLLMLLRTIIFKATIINEETGYEKKQKKNIQLHSITFHILMWKIERLERRCTNLHTKIYLKCKQVVCVWFYICRTDQCCASKIHKRLEKKFNVNAFSMKR